MLQIHEFWIELLPIFQGDYEFVYLWFDILTVIALLRAMFIYIPSAFGWRY